MTHYLSLYKKSARELAKDMIRDVLETTGITATAGIGTNLYLCKIAMDVMAKHVSPDADGVRIAELDEMTYRRELWGHRPLTSFWQLGRGIAERLEHCYLNNGRGIFTMGDLARVSVKNPDALYKMFGVNAEILIDHAWINANLPEERRRPLGFIQTPQSFYTPDVFQHNLYAERIVPNEQDYFYDVIEAAKTSSNSVIYGGSNTILSRKALEDIGGFYTKSITEDFATGMLIESAGYVSLGLSEALASGVAPSSFQEHVQQRTRWGRGVIATAKQLKFVRNRKLNVSQKLSYLSSVLYWFSPLKNLIYLISPLMFAVFCIPIFKCTLIDLALFWLPMHLLQIIALRITSQGKISAQWSGIYETSVMPFLLFPIIKESLGITLSTFKVTKKEKSSTRRVIDKRSLMPFAVLLVLTLAGIVRMTYLMVAFEYIGILAVLFWLIRNTYYLTMCLFLGVGRDSDGENVKVFAAEFITLFKGDGQQLEGVTTKLTEHSVDIFTDEVDVLYLGESVALEISNEAYDLKIKGAIVSIRHSYNPKVPSVYTVEVLDFAGQKDEYVQMLYDRTPTLPQRLRLRDDYLGNLWKNLGQRIIKI